MFRRHLISRWDEEENDLKKRAPSTSNEAIFNPNVKERVHFVVRIDEQPAGDCALVKPFVFVFEPSASVYCGKQLIVLTCDSSCRPYFFLIEFQATTSCRLEVNQGRAMMIYLRTRVERSFIPWAGSALFIGAEDETLRETTERIIASPMVPRQTFFHR